MKGIIYMLCKNSISMKGINYMLHENSIENQVKAMRKDNSIMNTTEKMIKKQNRNFEVNLSHLIQTNNLSLKEAQETLLSYGDRLKKEDPKLYKKLCGLIVTQKIIKASKLRLAQNKVPIKGLEAVLKYYGTGIKHLDPELYEQLKALEVTLKLKPKG